MTMDRTDNVSEREDDSGIESTAPDPNDNTVYIRIAVTDLKLQKCLQFSQDDLVWTAKQKVLSTVAKELKDGLNYGLYCPPIQGRAGKFLDEERLLRDYPLPGAIGFLEFKYKRRVYKQMQINQRKLKQLHTKAHLKQYADHVRRGEVDKVTKMAHKGLDPNFHDSESGECPLTLAAALEKPRSMLITLVSGGAHIDFRNRHGLTAMHRAAHKGNYEAIKTLLDLGASPNYKNAAGLTPLYLAAMHGANPHCVELLLHDHATTGATDHQGWTEVHHACKSGRVQHLEHLLFYGADMNVQNCGGNTPLHVCAVENQESCARVLLFRGCDRNVLNFSHQSAFQVAVISNNPELADVIQNFKEEDVVQFQELPRYNEKRRATIDTISTLQRCRSNPSLYKLFEEGGGANSISGSSIGQRSAPHYMSNGSLYSGSGHRQYDSDSPCSMSISSASGASLSGSYFSERSDREMYTRSKFPTLQKAHSTDGLDMLSVGEAGYWEGKADGCEGWFPSYCVEEVTMRTRNNKPPQTYKGQTRMNGDLDTDSVIIKRDTLAALTKNTGDYGPRTVVLQKGKSGFGFVLRGAKSQTAAETLEFSPTPDFPALQYLDRVDKGSPADRAGLKPGDFLLEINNENVMNATHEHTVKLIKSSRDTLAMKVITVAPLSPRHGMEPPHLDGTRTLPAKPRAKEKLDHTLAQYDSEADRLSLNSSAEYRGVDPNNKTASIRRTTKRLTVHNLDDMFVPPPVPPEQNASSSSSSVRPKYVTQVDLNDGKAESNGRGGHYQNQQNQQEEERIYAVPYKNHPNGGSNIPPPPSENAPQPPSEENSGGHVVAISTKQHQYANVSGEIAARNGGNGGAQSFESSFRPGIGARMNKEPHPAPAAAPAQHSRDSSLSSTVSSMSEATTATVTVAADIHNKPYYEPAPDYEEETDQVDLNAQVPAPQQQRRQAPPPPPPSSAAVAQYTEPSTSSSSSSSASSQFSDAIKLAATAREHRAHETKSTPPPRSTAAPPAPPPPPPPPGAPPPPPPISASQPAPPRRSSLPPHVQKQLEDKSKKDDAHAALMAAVAKRRNIVENADMDRVAGSIESRIHKTKKLQTTVYKSNNTKVELTPDPVKSPVPLLGSLRDANKNRGSVAPPSEPPPPPQPVSSPPEEPKSTSDKEESMLAKAERLRADYLRKKGMSTIEKKKEEGGKDDHPSASTIPKSSAESDRGGGGASAGQGAGGNVGELASVIAQQATQRQKSYDALENNNNNNTKTYKGNTNTGTKLSIDGATLESSQTESLKKTGVADKARLFGGRANISPPKHAPPPPPPPHSKQRYSQQASYSVHSNGGGDGLTMREELSVADIDVDYIPPPPVFDIAEDTTSVNSSVSTGTASSMDNGSHGGSSPKFTFNVPPVMEEEFVIPPIAPPPPGFDDDTDGGATVAPPMEFNTAAVSNLRSVLRPAGNTAMSSSTTSRSMTFPAVTRPYQTQPVGQWSVTDVGEWLDSIQLAEHRKCFARQGINGAKLLLLGRTELIALGVTQISHRMNIERALKKASNK